MLIALRSLQLARTKSNVALHFRRCIPSPLIVCAGLRLPIDSYRQISSRVTKKKLSGDDTGSKRHQNRPTTNRKTKKCGGTKTVYEAPAVQKLVDSGGAKTSKPTPTPIHQSPSVQPGVGDEKLLREQRRDPETWIHLLEPHIPQHLRHDSSQEHRKRENSSDLVTRDVLKILFAARREYNFGADLLTYMCNNSRKRAALSICDALLKNLVSRAPQASPVVTPSNILWPRESLDHITRRSIGVETVTHASSKISDQWTSQEMDPRYSSIMSEAKDQTMNQIWLTIGSLVLQSADMLGDDAENAMNAAQLILGQVHNLNLVPDNVYAYHASNHLSTVQRPPIIHLVSSRILTALSDAAWREKQEENIQEAASHGLSYEEIGRDPPGGRFRLKVRPMGPEIWLEFVLWCCVEGGFENAGVRLINLLQSNSQDPWFAVTWSNSSRTGYATPNIDWDRVKSRTGGTVGRIEGYSKGEPLAEVPPRTISTEVVLALAEAHVDAVKLVEGANGITLEAAQRGVAELITFLEPHDLPISYLEYISGRLLATGCFDPQSTANLQSRSRGMKQWLDRITHLKSLASVRPAVALQMSFHLESLYAHSEFTVGFMHQVLDSYVQDGNIHQALRVFNDLQELVDNSKLHAIRTFLQHTRSMGSSFFSPRGHQGITDFVHSHGQLPLYKLASLLNLATDSSLVGFGQWLLYSTDPDGPLIPRNVYNSPSVSRSLMRFAALSDDTRLLTAVSKPARNRLPTITNLRTQFNAQVSLFNMKFAETVLRQLDRAQGGGYSLSNLAHLAAAILKLEQDGSRIDITQKQSTLYVATYMLNSMLSGRRGGLPGLYHQQSRTAFRQQVTHLLNIFKHFRGSSVASLALEYTSQFRATNIPNLSPAVFNTFLESVVQTRGAMSGVLLVDTFCISHSGPEEPVTPGDFIGDTENDLDVDEDSDIVQDAIKKYDPSTLTYIPFVSGPAPENRSEEDDPDITGAEDFCNVDEDHNHTITNAQLSEDESNSERMSSNAGQSSPNSSELTLTSPFFLPAEERKSTANDQSTGSYDPPKGVIEPVCVLNSRTIRLIVRQAMKEYDATADYDSRKEFHQILRWAQDRFSKLGITNQLLHNEIKEPILKDALADLDTTKPGADLDPASGPDGNPIPPAGRFRRVTTGRVSVSFRPTEESNYRSKVFEYRDLPE